MTTLGPAAGWYSDPAGGQGQRYWDGSSWTNETTPVPAPTRLPEHERAAILDRALTSANVTQVITRSPTTAAVMVGQPVNHVVHLLATVFLCGLWLPCWILIAITNGQRRHSVTVDEVGQVVWRRVG